mgnify:CR=1 FL=1
MYESDHFFVLPVKKITEKTDNDTYYGILINI